MPVRSLSECLFEKTPCSVNIFLKKIIATLSGMEEKTWILSGFLLRNFYSSFGGNVFPVIKLILFFFSSILIIAYDVTSYFEF